MLLFVGDSPEVAEKFAEADPYVTSGAVKRWHVREWKTVAGEDAAMPIKPDAVAAGKTVLYYITVVVASLKTGNHSGTTLGRAIGSIWIALGISMFCSF